MPQLRVDTAALRMSADRLDTTTVTASSSLSQNAAGLAESQSGWAGSTFAAFEHVRDAWERKDAARTARLEDISVELARSADLYEEQDASSGAAIDSTDL